MAQVTYQYEIPYSSFDWQSEFIGVINEFALDSAVEVMQEHKAAEEIEWKDIDAIMNEVFRYGLMDKVLYKMREKYDNYRADSF